MARGFQMLAELLESTRAEHRTSILGLHVLRQFDDALGPSWRTLAATRDTARCRAFEEWDWFTKELQAFDKATRRAA